MWKLNQGGALSEFVAANRDLIRKDKRKAEEHAFERLKAELQRAFAAADSEHHRLTAADVIKRNRARRSHA